MVKSEWPRFRIWSVSSKMKLSWTKKSRLRQNTNISVLESWSQISILTIKITCLVLHILLHYEFIFNLLQNLLLMNIFTPTKNLNKNFSTGKLDASLEI